MFPCAVAVVPGDVAGQGRGGTQPSAAHSPCIFPWLPLPPTIAGQISALPNLIGKIKTQLPKNSLGAIYFIFFHFTVRMSGLKWLIPLVPCVCSHTVLAGHLPEHHKTGAALGLFFCQTLSKACLSVSWPGQTPFLSSPCSCLGASSSVAAPSSPCGIPKGRYFPRRLACIPPLQGEGSGGAETQMLPSRQHGGCSQPPSMPGEGQGARGVPLSHHVLWAFLGLAQFSHCCLPGAMPGCLPSCWWHQVPIFPGKSRRKPPALILGDQRLWALAGHALNLVTLVSACPNPRLLSRLQPSLQGKAVPCCATWAIPRGRHGQCRRGGGGLASAARASPLNGLWKIYLLRKLVASRGRIWHGRLEWKILTACKKVWLVLLWGNQQLAGIQLAEETPELLCERAALVLCIEMGVIAKQSKLLRSPRDAGYSQVAKEHSSNYFSGPKKSYLFKKKKKRKASSAP